MNEHPLITAARAWVIHTYPYNRTHLLRALDLLDELAHGAPLAVRLATVTHDMERAFPGPDQPVYTRAIDPAYETAHARRSARIVGEWLRAQAAEAPLVDEIVKLVEAHEVGGWPDADLVQAADCLSFLETNVDLFLGFIRSGRFGADEVRAKFNLCRDRIRPRAFKAVAAPLAAEAQARLEALEDDMKSAARS